MASKFQPRNGTTGLARALSKLGFCSRSHAAGLIREGKVELNGTVRTDPQTPVRLGRDRLSVDGKAVQKTAWIYLMLNKPRGLVTTTADEKGRQTVFECLAGKNLPFVAPVGRLDRASEGLLLFTNDTAWAARIIDPSSRIEKTYHVQIDRIADDALLDQLKAGMELTGEILRVKHARLLRRGEKNCWLEIVLDEGRNRHIRRLLEALGVGVARLVRVAIGGLALRDLRKGDTRLLDAEDLKAIEQPFLSTCSDRLRSYHLPS